MTAIKYVPLLENNCVGKLANGGTEFYTRIKCKILCNLFLLAFSANVFTVLASDEHNLKVLNL